MYAIVLGFHIFFTILLILAILIQSGKGSSLKEAFGGGSSDMFGPGTPENIMTKITTILVILFFTTSIMLTIMSSSGKAGSSIVNKLHDTPVKTIPQNKPIVPTESK
ncbi:MULTISPECIES: preprotein translocase subunit SecG [Calditerrivibrio]|uniref:Protein-export membrane protein SecG n=1 Tax=Calditerrivibrio nitroreducens TaxID=477976 RepID=A0A2J6WMC6_9BACT|nr:MAG: preprotein translocase subunit SecG [Calditerrivibrio nitroreducens]